MEKISTFTFYKEFLKKAYHLTKDRKNNLIFIFILLLIGSLLEVLSIGLFLPALEYFNNNQISLNFFETNFSKEKILFVILFTILLIFFIKFIFFVFLLKQKNNFLVMLSTTISKKLFKKIIRKPYEYFLKNTTPHLMNITGTVDGFCFGIVYNLLLIVIDLFTVLFFLIFLSYFNFFYTVITIVFVCIISFLYIIFFRNKIEKISKDKFFHTSKYIKLQQDCFNGIKEVKLNSAENFFINKFEISNYYRAYNTLLEDYIKALPKLIFEISFVFLFVFFVLFSLDRNFSLSSIQVTLGVFALCAFKIIPLCNRLLFSFQTIRFKIFSFNKIFEAIKDGLEDQNNYSVNEKITFNNEIKLKNVNFTYPNTEVVILDKLNLSIPMGKSIGIYGESGSGKTTILNLLTGLLKPTEGEIILDGNILKSNNTEWQSQVGYVPQSVYLTSDTLAENIAYGSNLEDVDKDLLNDAIKASNLFPTINVLPNKEKTLISEAGRNFSGGQIQRIGIARGLYKKPKILILDESTSNLDESNEKEILNTLMSLKNKITIIFISHKLKSLEFCDKIYELKNKKLNEKK